MGFLDGLFGSSGKPPTLSDKDIDQAYAKAKQFNAPTAEETELLKMFHDEIPDVEQAVRDQTAALHQRGEGLADVDADYMERAFKPAYERLMQAYGDQDRGLMEGLNKRGIAAIPGGSSEQEAFMRDRLSESNKRAVGQTMLEAQNQAVQQKLSQYNARLAETTQANTRRSQVVDPYYNATVTPESQRKQNESNVASGIYNARLGQQNNNFQTTRQNQMDLLGAGIGAGSMALMASDVNVKKDFQPANSPEADLEDMNSIPVSQWHYKGESADAPLHTGGMAQDMPGDVSDGKSVDVPTYLGKATNAIQALTKKVNAFEQLLMGGA